ncbi:protein DMR6-LIKE OXYGENASE 1-like [Sesamum indicum]|uniref:Protein DMR6-LIKE OXYGENASE 1-like n=1 Tax=Sesamum indicum TaxID=4182 RepID=A0A6I9SMN6_SESIN|nr:protein DMR6-LIKE OXYGENASE 1-like [Sesamum indicum]
MASAEHHPFEFETALKDLANSANLKAVPSKFNFINESTALPCDSLPVIDFSAITAEDPDRRSQAINDLSNACQEWGLFILVNHGIPEELMNATFTATREFFSLPESEKKQYEAKSASDPIKCGNFNVADTSNQIFTLWREYLKLYFHPDFHCPNQPHLLREVLLGYSKRTLKLARKLMEAMSDALELERDYVDQVLKLDSSLQILAANLYPPCPEPDKAIGVPQHTDPGLFTFLIHNGVAGLQIEHNGQWFDPVSPQNSILVNVDDQLQILSNGRYKSVKHRAVLNSERERMSIIVVNGPSGEAVVGPATPLVQKDGRPLYRSMRYVEYVETQLTKTRINGKSLLEQRMI